MKKIKIAFIGPDSSGKTTLINNLKEELKKKGKTTQIFFLGWRDFYNPILRLFSEIYLQKKRKYKIKEEKLKRFRPRSWLFYIIYYSELWLRYFKILFSKNEYILIDRYFYDELAFAKGIKFKFFKIITPNPDLCFMLKVSSKVLKVRGEYISNNNLGNFYSHLEKLQNYFPIIEIDSTKSLSFISKEIKKLLIKHKCL